MYENIVNALAFVPPSSRDIWLKMGMAVKSETGDAGFAIWDQWSQGADNYNYKDSQSVWKSFKSGGVSIGSLIHEAKQNGFTPEKTTISAKEIERRQV